MPAPLRIASRDNPLLVRLRKLGRDSAGYRKSGEVWIEGEHLCAAYVQRGGAVTSALLSEPAWESAGVRDLARTAASTIVVPAALMKSLSTLDSPAAIGFVIPWPSAPGIEPEAPSVVLDRLQDAGNVGAVLRSAAAFGFTQVIALKGSAALWSQKVLRAGMGAHFGLRLIEGVNAPALGTLHAPLLATSSHADHALNDAALPWPCAWVLGHEGQGVSAVLRQACAHTLRIPQPGGEESLNVAAAAAVCFYESARQRGFGRAA